MPSLNLPLRLLTENEIFRLSVWSNPTNETSKGNDLIGNSERTLFEATFFTLSLDYLLTFQQTSWSTIVRTLWRINPAISVYLTDRYKTPVIRQEVGKLVHSNTVDVLGIPGALPFLLAGRIDPHVHRDLKVICI